MVRLKLVVMGGAHRQGVARRSVALAACSVSLAFGLAGCADSLCVDDGFLFMQHDESCVSTTTDAESTDTVAPALCGDGVVDPSESCDDGNAENSDECLDSCVPASCGDGFVWQGHEGCDDGNSVDGDACSNACILTSCGDGVLDMGEGCDEGVANSDQGACTNLCQLNVCGDGLVWQGQESCDDGNGVDEDECRNDCILPVCGDGLLDQNEGCDEGMGNSNNGECTEQCQPNVCGDGFVWTDEEECDDGNSDDDDACSNACMLVTCGNELQDEGEECDDGMDNSDQGMCTSLCQLNVCGDGLEWQGMEECDDGNADNNDACLGTCVSATCGDGFVWQGQEGCDDIDDPMCNECELVTCGNGVLDVGEGCDLGEDNSDQGMCTTLCQNNICGDNLVWQGMEECDDGNDDELDGCNSMCQSPNYIFVSSESYPGNLGGLAGADEKCQTLADASDKVPPGTYRAWLSDQNANAIDRIGTATGWLRPDGLPVARTQAELMSGALLYPPVLDENNVAVSVFSKTWTGTDSDGEATEPLCNDWTSEAPEESGLVGRIGAATIWWTRNLSSPPKCNMESHLYCIGIGNTHSLTFEPMEGRLAFLSNMSISADTGLPGADAVCQEEADMAGKEGTFKALLAEVGKTPKSRFSNLVDPWVRADGVAVFRDGEIMGNTLAGPLYLDVNGIAQPSLLTWGGASSPSTVGTLGTTCMNWTVTTGSFGYVMWSNFASDWNLWKFSNDDCSKSFRVMCFQE